jgi:hypothetical protein
MFQQTDTFAAEPKLIKDGIFIDRRASETVSDVDEGW